MMRDMLLLHVARPVLNPDVDTELSAQVCTQSSRATGFYTELSPQFGRLSSHHFVHGALATVWATELSSQIAITHFDVNIVGEKEDVSPDHMRAVLQGVIGLIDNSV